MWKRIKKHRYVQGTAVATGAVLQGFSKRRRQLIRLSLESAVLTLASLAIVGTQLFYPFHVVIGVGLYILSFIPLLYRLYLSRDTWQQYHAYTLTKNFVHKERWRFFFAAVTLLLVAVFLWLRPLDTNPFAGLSDEQIVQQVADDLYRSVTAMDYLETSGNELLVVLADTTEDANQTQAITEAFADFLTALTYAESLIETHRYFDTIPYAEWGTRLRSFMITSSLYTKKYELVHRIMMTVADSEHKKKALNHFMPAVGRADIYNEMTALYYHPKTRVRLTGGHLYEQMFVSDRDLPEPSYGLLRDKARASYSYLLTNFDQSIAYAPVVLEDRVEQQMFNTWFPIQKGVATAMGRTIISTRGKAGLITAADARLMQQHLQPGDIMLQRRNWHVSNVGIPGFWTHSALYTGDLATLDQYFASEFPLQGYESLSAYMAAETPVAYKLYRDGGDGIDQPAVLEAIEPGVVAQTLPQSADADFVVALRPALSKHDSLLALMRAFASAGKPYDFNFDFATRDALVCSELVYDAYFEHLPEKAGLHFETSVVNGRSIVSPYDMATKYVTESNTANPELEFVYFLRSYEDTKRVEVADEQTFRESIQWSKFSFLQPTE